MQKVFVSVTFLALLTGYAGAQTTSTVITDMGPFIPASPSDILITIASPLEGQAVRPSLSVFVAQREQQAARVAALRKEIAALEAQLADPRRTFQDSIEAMTGIEGELIRGWVLAHADTEFTHSIEPFISDLVRMRNARMHQLSSIDAFEPFEEEKIRRQWLNKQDELRRAETLLAAIEKQLDTLRTDRELDRRAHDLADVTKTIQVAPAAPIATLPGQSGTRPTPKPLQTKVTP